MAAAGAAIRVRPFAAGDAPRLRAIHEAARLVEAGGAAGPRMAAAAPVFAAGDDGADLRDSGILVAEMNGTVAGFAAVDGDEITWLYVDPALHRRGVGRALLRAAVARCGPVAWIEALAGNEAALALYGSEGFETVETIPAAGTAAACRMRRIAG